MPTSVTISKKACGTSKCLTSSPKHPLKSSKVLTRIRKNKMATMVKQPSLSLQKKKRKKMSLKRSPPKI